MVLLLGLYLCRPRFFSPKSLNLTSLPCRRPYPPPLSRSNTLTRLQPNLLARSKSNVLPPHPPRTCTHGPPGRRSHLDQHLQRGQIFCPAIVRFTLEPRRCLSKPHTTSGLLQPPIDSSAGSATAKAPSQLPPLSPSRRQESYRGPAHHIDIHIHYDETLRSKDQAEEI